MLAQFNESLNSNNYIHGRRNLEIYGPVYGPAKRPGGWGRKPTRAAGGKKMLTNVFLKIVFYAVQHDVTTQSFTKISSV